MRHNQKKKHLGRTTSHRKAMLSNMVTSLFERGRIRTTQAKAKEGRRLAEKLITFAKRGDLHARRQVRRTLHQKPVVKRLFDEIAPRFADRNGGYTRIVKLGPRLGDRAPMVLFELLGEPQISGSKEEKKKKEKASGDRKKAPEGAKKVKGRIRGKKSDLKKGKKSSPAAQDERKTKAPRTSSRKTPQG